MTLRTSYDLSEFDFDRIVPAIQQSYWGEGRSAEGIKAAFANSFPAGLFHAEDGQIGWVRATSDCVYHAYIFDLIVVPDYRAQGLGKRMTQDIMNHPDLRAVTGWMLSTRYHHDLYRPFGFKDGEPGRYMALKRVT